MQTFMPMIGYRQSLEALDDARLNKQVLECSQIIDTIMDETLGYQNHPAVVAWRGNVLALCNYGSTAAAAWRERKGTGLDRQGWFHARRTAIFQGGEPRSSNLTPPWVGDLNYHRSHRSNLIRKDPAYYDQWPSTPEYMPYLWPVSTGRDSYKLYVSAADMNLLLSGDRSMPDWLKVEPDGEVQRVL